MPRCKLTAAPAVLESRGSAPRCRPKPDRARSGCGTSEDARACRPAAEASEQRTLQPRFTLIPAAAILKPSLPDRATWMFKPVRAESACAVSYTHLRAHETDSY